MKQKEKVVIIGAGLSGLTLAYELEKKGIRSLVLEASDRSILNNLCILAV